MTSPCSAGAWPLRIFSAALSLGVSVPVPVFCAHAEELTEKKLLRVVNVSVSYFDLPPPSEPFFAKQSFEFKTLMAFLPAIKEKDLTTDVPNFHALGQVQFKHTAFEGEKWSLGSSAWAGSLIPGSEKIVALTIKPKQWLLGFELRGDREQGGIHGFASAGFQFVRSVVKNLQKPIPADLDAQSEVPFAAVGIHIPNWGMWSSLTLAHKDTRIKISTGGETFLEKTDRLQDAPFPLLAQGSLGYFHKKTHIHGGISELWIPERLVMPRIFVGYVLDFDGSHPPAL